MAPVATAPSPVPIQLWQVRSLTRIVRSEALPVRVSAHLIFLSCAPWSAWSWSIRGVPRNFRLKFGISERTKTGLCWLR
jgi:hypothetical protein